jgi:hypothetical protein
MPVQAVLCTERDLADPDSLFRRINGVEVHFKRTMCSSRSNSRSSSWSSSSSPTTRDHSATDLPGSAAEQGGGAGELLGIACYHGFGVSGHPLRYCFANTKRKPN